MLLKVFTVFDSKTGVYDKPFLLRSKGEALRGFTDVANDKNNMIGKYPTDYTLFELGDYFDDSGKFVLHATPISCAVASELVKPV